MTHGGLRAQKPPLPGKRPGVLLDPEPVQVVDAVTSYVAAPGPSSLVPRLAANDALDNATLKFLVARALLDRREQEEERRKREEEVKKRKKALLERLTAEGRRELEQRLDSGGASSKRKRKKEEEADASYLLSSLPLSSSATTVVCLPCWFHWLRYTSRYVLFCRRQAQDAVHHGRYASGGQLRSVCWLRCPSRCSVAIPQVQFLVDLLASCVQRQVLWSRGSSWTSVDMPVAVLDR